MLGITEKYTSVPTPLQTKTSPIPSETSYESTPVCIDANHEQTEQSTPSLFSSIKMAPIDPILGINQAFAEDKNPNKINLSVGVYYDDNGKIPVLECVQKAEAMLSSTITPHTYLPIEGLSTYNKAVQNLVFGADSKVVSENRVATVQALGGTGALRVGADFLKRFYPDAQVWISDPSWENHRAIFESAGFKVNTYPYFDPSTHGVNFDGMLESIKNMPEKSIVLLHACCHNPTGADLTADQWTQIIDVVAKRELIPFLDMAYQGFGDGIDADGVAVRRFADAGIEMLVSNSFSKSFALYDGRVGALSVVTKSRDETECVLSQLKRTVRVNYSNPPAQGAKIVGTVLCDKELRELWEQELTNMRERISEYRQLLVSKLKEKAPNHDFSFIANQRGMFSYSGLTKEQVTQLRLNNSIYALETGRICIAALNPGNIDKVVDAICAVL